MRPLNVPKSAVLNKGKQKGFALQTAAMAGVMSARGTSIAVSNNIASVWNMARELMKTLPRLDPIPADIKLVQDFLRTEVSESFELVEMLSHGVGVHHASLSDEARSLIEWLTEAGLLRVLCATSTVAQGINFPVSSIFLSSRHVPQGTYSKPMGTREFWNLAGRAGRFGQDSVGVVGLAEADDRDAIIKFVSEKTGALASRLVKLLDDLKDRGELQNLKSFFWQEQWEDFRSYIAHLWSEKKNLEAVLADSEQLLRQTFGYTSLRNDPAQRDKAEALLSATKAYATELAASPGIPELADSTGFSPEGVKSAMAEMRQLENKLTKADWTPESLFGSGGKIADLYGVMLKIPQIKQQLEQVGGEGFDKKHLSNITRDWVNGASIDKIALDYFAGTDGKVDTDTLTETCKAIYRSIVNNGTWGISALSRMSGIPFQDLPEAERRKFNAVPAMIYHGVRSEDAVLMRMNSAPRSASEGLATQFRQAHKDDDARLSVGKARDFLKTLSVRDWETARPKGAALTGEGYKKVWEILSGEGQ